MPHDERTGVVLGWFKKAENDLKNISLVLPNPDCPFDTVCFHAQQAAEKYLKGLLIQLDVSFPKTHDIAKLLELVPEEVDLGLSIEDLAPLSRWAVFPRYPDFEEDLQRTDAETTVKLAQTVKAAVLDAVGRYGFNLDLLHRPTKTEEES